MEVRPFEPDDRSGVDAMLAEAGLSTIGLHEDAFVRLVAVDGVGIAGFAAVEPFGHSGLLRSVATARRARGVGLGRRLVRAAESAACTAGLTRLYLLTETAEGFFARLGYEIVGRDSVPESVRRSTQFVTLCPASATAMERGLNE